MRKFKILFTLLLFSLVTAQLVTGCASNDATRLTTSVTQPVTTTTFGSPEVIEGQIYVDRVHVESSLVTFYGTAGLPDGTILHSLLIEGEEPLSWWPTDMDMLVQNGQWTASVALDERGQVKNILVGPSYYYKVYQKDNPTNTAGAFFDLIGPPPIEPWWRRGIFREMFGIALGIIVIIIAGVYGIMRWRHRVKTESG